MIYVPCFHPSKISNPQDPETVDGALLEADEDADSIDLEGIDSDAEEREEDQVEDMFSKEKLGQDEEEGEAGEEAGEEGGEEAGEDEAGEEEAREEVAGDQVVFAGEEAGEEGANGLHDGEVWGDEQSQPIPDLHAEPPLDDSQIVEGTGMEDETVVIEDTPEKKVANPTEEESEQRPESTQDQINEIQKKLKEAKSALSSRRKEETARILCVLLFPFLPGTIICIGVWGRCERCEFVLLQRIWALNS